MLLRAKSRMLLLSVLPAIGNFDTLRIVRDLQSDLSFSEEEHKTIGFEEIGEVTRWEEERDPPVDVSVGEKATDVIVEALKQLSSKRQLRAELLPLYEHFVEEKEWVEAPIPTPQDTREED